jgi:hypothetical protein
VQSFCSSFFNGNHFKVFGQAFFKAAPRAKFLVKLFLKSLRFPKAEPWSLVATSEISFTAFLFS